MNADRRGQGIPEVGHKKDGRAKRPKSFRASGAFLWLISYSYPRRSAFIRGQLFLPYFHCRIAEQDPGASDVHVSRGGLCLTGRIAERHRRSAVQKAKELLPHLVLSNWNRQT